MIYRLLFILILVSCKTEIKNITVFQTDVGLKLINGELFYKGELFSGRLVDFYKNDSLRYQAFYIDGRKEGIEQYFYKNGQVNTCRMYKKGVKIGVHDGWWQDGSRKFQYHFNEKGQYHGSVKEWFKNGQLFKIFNYLNGKEKGKQRMYEVNGDIRANYEVINGERFGLIGLKKCYTLKKDSI